jgi:hypothetical protein
MQGKTWEFGKGGGCRACLRKQTFAGKPSLPMQRLVVPAPH